VAPRSAFGVAVDAATVEAGVGVDELEAPAMATPAVERTAAVVAVAITVRSFMTEASSRIVRCI
jgi:hypothetical protein